jgi:CSLREA domain-containing protein
MIQVPRIESARRKFVMLVALALLLGAFLVVGANPAQADTTFTVNSTADPGTGDCDAAECTLREAIDAANSAPNTTGPDQIVFNIPDDPNIPGDEVKTIRPTFFLPSITDPVILDGYTQPGASPATSSNDAVLKIELNGEAQDSTPLRLFDASGSVVRGLAINRSPLVGVAIVLGTGSQIEGNYIGTDPSGTQDLGNGFDGVEIYKSSGNIVGGSTPEKRNVISGNGRNGITIRGDSPSNKVEGNYIGTQKDGTSALGNDTDGLLVGTSGNSVGGTTSGAANTTAYNKRDGVRISDVNTINGIVPSTGNRVLGNSVFSNGELGIDLEGNDGRTPNDPRDRDKGANTLQNFPALTLATTSSSGATAIKGKLNSTPRKAFTIQFFSNPAGTDEGKTYLGERKVKTSRRGNASFTFTPTQAVPIGEAITATATNSGGNTSEFSDPLAVSQS